MSKENIEALVRLWNLTQEHPGTGGAVAAVKLLLVLYDGLRFPFDLRELRRFDGDNLSDSLAVIYANSAYFSQEIHQQLNSLTGRTDFGWRFEHLAYDYKLKGRCKKAQLMAVEPAQVVISLGGVDG